MSTFATKPDQREQTKVEGLCVRWRLGTGRGGGELCWRLRIAGRLLEEACAQHTDAEGTVTLLWHGDRADTDGRVEIDPQLDLVHVTLPEGLLTLTCHAPTGEVLYARTTLVDALGYAGGRSERLCG